MQRNKILGILLSSGLIWLSSCNKDSDTIANDFVTSSEDYTAQQDLLDANESEITDQIDAGLLALTTRSFPTRTWTNPKGTFPNTLTIDYGPDGVTGPYGHVRKGKIIVQISAPLKTVGSVRTVSHQDFFIDDVRVEGTVSLTNQGPNGSGQNIYLRNVVGRKLTFPSGKTINWNANQIITQLEGNATPDIRLDDVWSILGTSSGTNRSGKQFNVSTPDALVFKFTCPWIVQGSILLSVDNNSLSIDYGDGNCNNDALLTLPDGTTRNIKIRRWW